MPKDRLVVSDTSPLLNLALIDRLELLENQFSHIVVPEQVWHEIQEGEKGVEGIRELADRNFLDVVEVEEDQLFHELSGQLDIGESAAIRYALKEEAELVLMDEKEGRSKARKHGLKTTGVIGILLKASKNNRIEMREELDRLRENGFWISDKLYSKILEKSNET